jgi:hypothetical protein
VGSDSDGHLDKPRALAGVDGRQLRYRNEQRVRPAEVPTLPREQLIRCQHARRPSRGDDCGIDRRKEGVLQRITLAHLRGITLAHLRGIEMDQPPVTDVAQHQHVVLISPVPRMDVGDAGLSALHTDRLDLDLAKDISDHPAIQAADGVDRVRDLPPLLACFLDEGVERLRIKHRSDGLGVLGTQSADQLFGDLRGRLHDPQTLRHARIRSAAYRLCAFRPKRQCRQ